MYEWMFWMEFLSTLQEIMSGLLGQLQRAMKDAHI
jgi:hypothetical protein